MKILSSACGTTCCHWKTISVAFCCKLLSTWKTVTFSRTETSLTMYTAMKGVIPEGSILDQRHVLWLEKQRKYNSTHLCTALDWPPIEGDRLSSGAVRRARSITFAYWAQPKSPLTTYKTNLLGKLFTDNGFFFTSTQIQPVACCLSLWNPQPCKSLFPWVRLRPSHKLWVMEKWEKNIGDMGGGEIKW